MDRAKKKSPLKGASDCGQKRFGMITFRTPFIFLDFKPLLGKGVLISNW